MTVEELRELERKASLGSGSIYADTGSPTLNNYIATYGSHNPEISKRELAYRAEKQEKAKAEAAKTAGDILRLSLPSTYLNTALKWNGKEEMSDAASLGLDLALPLVGGAAKVGTSVLKPIIKNRKVAKAISKSIDDMIELQRHTYLKPGTLTESKGSVAKLYEPITRTPDGSTSLAFLEKPSKITIAEKLGIPKRDRGNLNRFQKEALDDLSQYVESGQYRQIPQIQSTGVTWGGTAAESPVNQGIKLGGTARGSDDWLYIRSIPQANGTTISYQPTFNEFGVSAEKLFPEQFGEAVLFRNGIQEGKIILTAPRTDALPGGGGALQHYLPPGVSASHYDYLPNTIDKSIMRPFWETVESTRRPGTYFSGDQGVAPLGATLIQNYTKRLAPRTKVISNGQSQVVGVQGYAPLLEELNRPIKYTTHSDALSTDSYMALLKQGNRPGYSLRFSPDGMETFANVGVQHKNMRDLLLKAQSGEIPKEAFITQFNNWVAPYNGMPAKIVNGEIWMPHPFVYKKQRGGSLNYLNYIK